MQRYKIDGRKFENDNYLSVIIIKAAFGCLKVFYNGIIVKRLFIFFFHFISKVVTGFSAHYFLFVYKPI